MRTRAEYASLARSPRLYRRTAERPETYWTAALGEPPAVYGERTAEQAGTLLRRWDPSRSKLGAAIARGWTEPLPRPGERWLYLGAASGTTASHVADLVGPAGAVFAVEKSLRSFARLLRLAGRYPNLGPILADARRPDDYLELVPPVDGLYLDLAQPDQAEIALANARRMLKRDGGLLLALKTSSMGRDLGPRGHLERTVAQLEDSFEVGPSMPLEPFHRKHYLVGAWATKRIALDAGGTPPARPPTRPPSRAAPPR